MPSRFVEVGAGDLVVPCPLQRFLNGKVCCLRQRHLKHPTNRRCLRSTVVGYPTAFGQHPNMIWWIIIQSSSPFSHTVVVTPPITPSLKCSSCTPLWYVVYRLRPGARCVIHTHSMFASLASVMVGEATEFHITHFEMMKGVGGHANDCDLLVPIIENRPSEDQLEEQVARGCTGQGPEVAVLAPFP